MADKAPDLEMTELHTIIDNLGNENLTDEDYAVVVVEINRNTVPETFTVHRIREVFADSTNGSRILSLVIETKSENPTND